MWISQLSDWLIDEAIIWKAISRSDHFNVIEILVPALLESVNNQP
jgi:hypothetical protein